MFTSLILVTAPVMLYNVLTLLTVTFNSPSPTVIGSSWNLSTTLTSILTFPTVLFAIVTVVFVGNLRAT